MVLTLTIMYLHFCLIFIIHMDNLIMQVEGVDLGRRSGDQLAYN